MDVIFRRSQRSDPWFVHYVRFKLKCHIELTDSERTIINKYNFDRSILIEVDQPNLFRKSALIALFAFLISIPLLAWNLWREIGMGWTGILVIAALIGLIFGYMAYHQFRETIYVKDLIHGRYFKCKSVVELARREAGLESICGYLRQVMESAKHCDGDERHEILPLPPEEAKRAILSGPIF